MIGTTAKGGLTPAELHQIAYNRMKANTAHKALAELRGKRRRARRAAQRANRVR